jgi:hypothetical protein
MKFIPIDNIYTYTSSLTVGDTVYTYDKATWQDKSAWVNSSWIYGEEVGITPDILEREWDIWWHQALNNVMPLEVGTNGRDFGAFRINNIIAGFYQGMYCHTDTGEKVVRDFRANVLEEFRGQGHYKYMYALGANKTAKLGYNMDVTIMHNAHGVRKHLVQTEGMTHRNSSKMRWKDKNGNEVWRQYFDSDVKILEADLNAKWGDIPYIESYTTPEDPRWASPMILEYLGTSTIGPSPNEGL